MCKKIEKETMKYFENKKDAQKDIDCMVDSGKTLLVIDDSVYDLTNWIHKHPGGSGIITQMNGKDASDHFYAFHVPHGSSKRAYHILKNMPVVMKIKPRERNSLEKDFLQLREKINSDPVWFQTPRKIFLCRLAWLTLLFVASVVTSMHASTPLRAVLGGLLTAFFFQQAAFVGHDAGHSAVFQDKKMDNIMGMIFGPLLTSIGIFWWRSTHNQHHSQTNSVENDCDIQHLPMLAASSRFLKLEGVFSNYHQRTFRLNAVSKWFIERQHWLFFPLMTVARFNLYLQTFMYHLHKRDPEQLLEIVCLFLHYVGIYTLKQTMSSSKIFIVWYLTANCCAGVLHLQIILSHYTMNIYTATEKLATESFLIQQTSTTLDISSTWYNNFLHGGLNLQTTHHVFPRVCRDHLHVVKNMLETICRRNKIEYKTVSFYHAVALLLARLRKNAHCARAVKVPSFQETILYDILFCVG